MLPEEPKTKIFLSCGQQKGTPEVAIAEQIHHRLEQKGFDVYVAVEQQSLAGLKENIFAQLESSEYFLFIDFKREELRRDSGTDIFYRGSLFCHQELALASFLGLEVIGLQEKGVKTDDGIRQFVQANFASFSDRDNLPDVVMGAVERLGWKNGWKNALSLSLEPEHCIRHVRNVQTGRVGDYYCVHVHNRHRSKHALNCYVYLDKVLDLCSGEELELRPIEHSWGGYAHPNAAIRAAGHRPFDTFHLEPAAEGPRTIGFTTHATATPYLPPLKPVGDYELTYVVISENFPNACGTFQLHLGERSEDVRFEALPDRK